MTYLIKGRICGRICDECEEPLTLAKIRIYRTAKGANVTAAAVANPKDTFAILDADAIKERQSRLIAEAAIGDDGSYVVTIGDNQKYGGEAVDVDIYCGTMRPGGKVPPRPEVQIALTTLQPMWRKDEAGSLAIFEYCLPERYWCAVLAQLGLWVICGRLTTCSEPVVPIAGATVRAFDVDWLQDDALGAAVTDGSGRFRIYYVRADFETTIFSPTINLEWTGGPDVYFRVEFNGAPILVEPRSKGRTPGRENVGHCLCVSLCTDERPHDPPGVETQPHWTRVEIFNVHAQAADPPHNFLAEGYAGLPIQAYVFGGGVALLGNCPLFNAAAPANRLKFRFLFAEWTWSVAGEPAGVMPNVPPPPPPSPLAPTGAWRLMPWTNGSLPVGDIYYNDGLNPLASVAVRPSPDFEGFITMAGTNVSAPLNGGGSVTLSVDSLNFLRSGLLMYMDTAAMSALHASRRPAWASDKMQAGRALVAAEKEPIRRYRMIFEVRDATTNVAVFTDVLDSIILDNSLPVGLLNISELMADACNPIMGMTAIHPLHTVDHPHLRYFNLTINNNNGVVHPAPPMPHGEFTAGAFLFRGAASGPAGPSNAVDISADPVCAYSAKLRWSTRHYLTGESVAETLYCKE